MKRRVQQILEQTFGFKSFRSLQQESIEAILAKKDLLTILPTGGGKSLCYQLPALVLDAQITIVISPLIALINDQVINLGLSNISADKLTSEQNAQESAAVVAKIFAKKLSLLYVSPERANMPSFKRLLGQMDVGFIVIDEAHCVSEWGHEFRPDYRQLHFLKEEFPHIPIAAFTATATKRVAQDIIASLHLHNPVQLVGSFFRNNLALNVQKRSGNGRNALHSFLKNYDAQSGIVYTFTRKECEDLAHFLRQKGFDAEAYHAGLASHIRKETQEKFIKDSLQIIVATIAFGMGIDKSNVRFVVHMDLPKSMESYYQEIGRAGRDGLPSECLLLYSTSDVVRKSELMNSIEDEKYRNGAKNKIEELYNYANSKKCRHQALVEYFEQDIPPCESLCDNCQKEEIPQIDITREARMLLSCIYRSGQNFGAAYLVDILRGSKNQKLLENGHNKLSVYGIGSHVSKEAWGLVLERLFEAKAIRRGEFRELKITQFGAEVLKAKAYIYSDEDIFAAPKKEVALISPSEYKDENFEALRVLRSQIANEKGVPAYVVFSDATLKEIAQKLPSNPESFLDINGVGKVKLEQYGAAFIQKAIELMGTVR